MKRSISALLLGIIGAVWTAFAAPTATAESGALGELAVPSQTSPGTPQCQGISSPNAGAQPLLKIPLAVHVGGSVTRYPDICAIATEINEIMQAQAGICFEMEIDQVFVNTGNPRMDRSAEKRSNMLNLWLLSSGRFFPTAQNANGVFLGNLDEAYTLDRPSLSADGVRELPRNPAARTGAHELGHALSLRHQDCGADCNNLLMRSGHLGFELATGSPADTNEIARARNNAMMRILQRGLPNISPTPCAPPRFVVR